MGGANTHAALGLQVAADPAQVDLQPMHVHIIGGVVGQHVVQVEVQDVGVDAADLQGVLLRSKIRGQGRARRCAVARPEARLTWWVGLGAWGIRRTLGSSCSRCACRKGSK